MEVIKVEKVTRNYKIGEVETRALRGVDLSIENGEFTALVGPSGSGKTTLLQLIGCLDVPTSGQVYINGKDVSALNRNQRADIRRGTIGFIFQFFALIPTLTAYENIEMPLLMSNGRSPAQIRERVNYLLEKGRYGGSFSPSSRSVERRTAAEICHCACTGNGNRHLFWPMNRLLTWIHPTGTR